MTGARDITQLCCSPNLAGIVTNKIEQTFYSVYSHSGIQSVERAISKGTRKIFPERFINSAFRILLANSNSPKIRFKAVFLSLECSYSYKTF